MRGADGAERKVPTGRRAGREKGARSGWWWRRPDWGADRACARRLHPARHASRGGDGDERRRRDPLAERRRLGGAAHDREGTGAPKEMAVARPDVERKSAERPSRRETVRSLLWNREAAALPGVLDIPWWDEAGRRKKTGGTDRNGGGKKAAEGGSGREKAGRVETPKVKDVRRVICVPWDAKSTREGRRKATGAREGDDRAEKGRVERAEL